MPSCIRAPPEAGMAISAAAPSTAAFAAVISPSPTACPMEPPMKEKSNAAATTGLPPTVPRATTMASLSPDRFWASFSRSV